MVPDKFNMVDMEGIDLIESQGVAIEGLYDKLVESITQCRYQCLYNWKFNGINIPPTYIQMSVDAETGNVLINEGVEITDEDVIHIYSIEPPPPPVVTIEPISITRNGTYMVPEGVDGYNPVNVDVQPRFVVEYIIRPSNGYYNLTNWIFNNSDDFDWIYRNRTTPNNATQWPIYLCSASNPSSLSGNYLLVQGNFYSSRRVMNVGYAGQWSGDGTWSYDSPYDYVNYYKLSKRGKNFTLYKGASLDAIDTVAFTGTFNNSNDVDTDTMKLFWSNNSFEVELYSLVGYDSVGNIIHNYVPDLNGALKDLVDNTTYSPIGLAISIWHIEED